MYCVAQAKRWAANTATTAASAAAALAEQALSASPPFFDLSPPAKMESIASPPTPLSTDGPAPSIAASQPTPPSANGPAPAIAGCLALLVYAEDFYQTRLLGACAHGYLK